MLSSNQDSIWGGTSNSRIFDQVHQWNVIRTLLLSALFERSMMVWILGYYSHLLYTSCAFDAHGIKIKSLQKSIYTDDITT